MKTGLHGRPVTGVLGDAPHAVTIKRGRGYPWPPSAPTPSDYFIGASSLGSLVDPFNGTNWGINEAAKAAGSRRREMADYKNAADVAAAIKAAGQEATTRSRDVGSLIHNVTAHTDAGLPAPDVSDDLERDGHTVDLGPYLDSYAAFLSDCEVRIGSVERTLYSERLRTAGTADRLLIMGNPPESLGIGPTDLVVADLKTKYGKTLDRVKPSASWAIQLAALATSSHIYYEEYGDVLELPPIGAAVIVLLACDGYRLYRAPVEELSAEMASLAAAAHVAKALGSGVMGRPHSRHLSVPEAPKVTTISASS